VEPTAIDGRATAFPVSPLTVRASPAQRAARLADLSFGTAFTEHMVSLRWSAEAGWHDGAVGPLAPLEVSPVAVGLHYGQSVFEGLKAFRVAGGGLAVFRPDAHARRFRDSAARLRMPLMPRELFVSAVEELVRIDGAWLPDDPATSLYLRPLLFASEPTLALRPANRYHFLLVAFVTEGFFGPAIRPVTVWLCEDHVRAAPGGTGAAKATGNYAGGFLAQEQASAHGCDQVVWLDAVEREQVEEMGGMNLWFVVGEGTSARLVTPPLGGTILPGVTRDSLLRLAPEIGLEVAEERISVEQWRAGCRSGAISEVFACGTAARISPVGEVRSATRGSWSVRDPEHRPVTTALSDLLFGVQRGEVPDRHGWLHHVG
jgi:branched-chain amino acid aminotransferase